MTTTSERVGGAAGGGAASLPAEKPRGLGAALREYGDRIKGGDVGSLPAVLGLLALVIVFSALRPDRFTSELNVANLINQSAAVIVLAMGLVFVLLLGAATAYLSQERGPRPEVKSISGLPVVVVLLAVLVVALSFLLGRTAFGRHVYAVGGNAEAARRAGINVFRVKLACFVISSTLAAVAGLLLASRNNSISPTTGGADTLLYAVGAAVIGGTSLFGGKGKVLDAVLGGLVIAVIINGMLLLNRSSAVVFMVTGVVLLVAASVDALSRKRAAATGRG